MITTLLTVILFLAGIAVGVVALLEPLTGMLAIIQRYLRKLLSGNLIPDLEIDTAAPKKVARTSERRKSK